jgi:hypothetical protein
MFVEASDQPIIGVWVIAYPHNTSKWSMVACLPDFVEKVQAVAERDGAR